MVHLKTNSFGLDLIKKNRDNNNNNNNNNNVNAVFAASVPLTAKIENKENQA